MLSASFPAAAKATRPNPALSGGRAQPTAKATATKPQGFLAALSESSDEEVVYLSNASGRW